MKLPEAGWILIRPKKDSISLHPIEEMSNSTPNPTIISSRDRTITYDLMFIQPKSIKKISPLHLPIRHSTNHIQSKFEWDLLLVFLTSDGHRLFRGNHKNFADLIRMGYKMGVTIFVLTPK